MVKYTVFLLALFIFQHAPLTYQEQNGQSEKGYLMNLLVEGPDGIHKKLWNEDFAFRNHNPAILEDGCPYPDDILPCVCNAERLTIDCTNVTDADELTNIFQADFPVNNLHRLVIQGNTQLLTIPDDAFGDVSFEIMSLLNNSLENITVAALDGSKNTLVNIYARPNITQFPFYHLPEMKVLESVGVKGKYNMWTNMISSSLKHLFLGSDHITNIPELNLPALEVLSIDDNILTDIHHGRFKNLTSLKAMTIVLPEMTHLKTGTFEWADTAPVLIFTILKSNIQTVASGAIDFKEGMHVTFNSESLETLEESVWKPLVKLTNTTLAINDDGGVTSSMQCGCDIAWVMTHASFLDKTTLKCANGTEIHKLDSDAYLDCY